ncbi:MAG: hypothetical protein AAB019_01740 [Planctomycetota bacterium]
MKWLPVILMIGAALSLVLGMIFRVRGGGSELMGIPPQSFLEFTIAALLFSIAISLNDLANKKQ